MENKSLGIRIGLFAIIGGAFLFSALYGFTQTPPGKLTRQEMSRPNPLRASQPVPVPGTIKQTALVDEETPSSPPASLDSASLNSLPAVPSQTGTLTQVAGPALPAASFQSSAVPVDDPFATSMHELESFTDPHAESSTALPSFTSSPLSSADPFAVQQPQAAVPTRALSSVVEEPMTQETQFPARQPRVARTESTRSGVFLPQPEIEGPPITTVTAGTAEGTGMPGSSVLEGPQTPHLTIQKVLPEEVVIEQPATFKTVIHNVGNSAAKNVMITDRVPQGSRLLSTIPEADVSRDGELRWTVGNLDPNVQLVIEMKVLPIREGEIGSVASVHYTGEASGRIIVTRPMLKVEVRAPSDVKLGETAMIEITVSNPGTATATNIVLEERIPDGLYHRDGRVMQHSGITSLKPRESKKLTLPLLCTGAGNLVNHVIVTADGNLMVEDKTTIRASAPVLDLEIVGAKTRFLERKSDYRLLVANKGNASAHNVTLELALPAAVQFVSTNQSGVYEPSSHSVHWALEELPQQEAGEIELIVMPMQKGEHSLKFTGTGENNLKAETVHPIFIDGIPALTFEIVGDSNLVELGKDVVYEIRVANRGTRAADNVKVRVALAEGMTFVKAEGARYQAANGGVVQFETIPQLAAKSENVYKLTARCQSEGDHRINVQVISDDLRSPITKEESTRVFR